MNEGDEYVCTVLDCIGDCADCVDQEQNTKLRELVQRWINREVSE